MTAPVFAVVTDTLRIKYSTSRRALDTWAREVSTADYQLFRCRGETLIPVGAIRHR